MGVVDEKHLAGGPAHHLQTVPSGSGKGQIPAEHTPGPQLLHHGGHALLVDADQCRRPPLYDAHVVLLGVGKVIDQLVGLIRPPHRLKAGQHPSVLLVTNIPKQRTLLQLPGSQHIPLSFLLHIRHHYHTSIRRKCKGPSFLAEIETNFTICSSTVPPVLVYYNQQNYLELESIPGGTARRPRETRLI